MNMRRRIFKLIELTAESGRFARILNAFFVGVIVISVLEVIAETEPSLNAQFGSLFRWIEVMSIVVFSIEYVLRLWTICEIPKYGHPMIGRMKYAITPMAIIDLLSVLPAYVPFLLPFDLRVLRVLRLFRVFRLFKLGRYVTAIRKLGIVIHNKSSEIVIALSAALLILIIMSTLVFFAECEAQPAVFKSIPVTLWWGVITLTTVGYGDMYPVTLLGRVLGSVIAVMGIGIVAVPAGIVASGFLEEQKSLERKCPKCGARLN